MRKNALHAKRSSQARGSRNPLRISATTVQTLTIQALKLKVVAPAVVALAAAGLVLDANAQTQDGKKDAQESEQNVAVRVHATDVGAAPEATTPPDVKPGDAQDVFFLGDSRPVKMRLHLQVGEEAFLNRWKTYIGSLFGELDADKDGLLSQAEAAPLLSDGKPKDAAAPAAAYMRNTSNDPRLPKSAAEQLAAAPLSQDDFVKAMRGSFVPLVTGTSPTGNMRGSDMIIRALDVNGDQKIDAEEIMAARKNLLTLDANDDEIVNATELTGESNTNTYVIGGQAPQFSDDLPQRLRAVGPDQAAEIAREIVARYDAGDNKDGKLAAAEINIGDTFAANDKDQDGALDLTELTAYVESGRPDLELVASLSNTPPQGAFKFANAADDEDKDAEQKDAEQKDGDSKEDKKPGPKSGASMKLNTNDLPADVRMKLMEAIQKAQKDGKPFKMEDLPEDVKTALEEAQQKNGDKKEGAKNEEEEEEEPAGVNVSVNGNPLNVTRTKMWHLVKSETHDATLNAKVQETENGLVIDLDRFRIEFSNSVNTGMNFAISRLEEQQFGAMDMDSNKYLDETEAGRFGNNFARMDANGDKMIFLDEYKAFLAKQKSAAESQLIATAEDHGHQLFKMLDANADNQLSLREVYYAKQRLQEADHDGDGTVALTEIPHNYQVKLAMGQPSLGGVFAVAVMSGMSGGQTKKGVGPDWFQKMDKNGDGDVSQREFLGTAEDFQRVDTDSDELISVKEAEAVKTDNE